MKDDSLFFVQVPHTLHVVVGNFFRGIKFLRVSDLLPDDPARDLGEAQEFDRFYFSDSGERSELLHANARKG